MARERLAALGTNFPAEADPDLDRFKAPVVPVLDDSFPDDSPHLAKAKLLANAGLNDYIPQEIAADPDSASWSALAEAQIYASDGETFRAMRALKRALPYAATASINVDSACRTGAFFSRSRIGRRSRRSRRRIIWIHTL